MEGPEVYPNIHWRGYRGMGNFLRHSYHRVSNEIVWNTLTDDLPVLKTIVEEALVKPGEEPGPNTEEAS